MSVIRFAPSTQRSMRRRLVSSLGTAEMRAALGRLADGSYGVCQRCESPIPIARLRAIPEARWCVTCRHQPGEDGHRLALAGP